MARTVLFGAVMCAIMLIAATTRSDVVATDVEVDVDDTSPIPEVITGAPAVSPPSSESPAKDPLAPFDVGPPESVWPYESLTAEEQALVDQGRDTDAWEPIHEGFAAAVGERSRRARAEVAQHLLGVDSIDDMGVVP